MIVVSSRYEIGVPQIDGRSYVHEWHELDDGTTYEREYGPVDTSAVDLQAVADEFARVIEVAAPFFEGP